jgi:hypothetical protein
MNKKIKYFIFCTKNIISFLWYKFIALFGYKPDKKHIPPGFYCYEPDYEKNKTVNDFSSFYIKPCKYYKHLGKGYNACTYVGVISDDSVFDDQCKICGEKYD